MSSSPFSTLAICAIQAGEAFESMKQALIVAREFISTDRNSLADCSMDPDGHMDPDDAAAVAEYDAALLQINEAIAKAGSA